MKESYPLEQKKTAGGRQGGELIAQLLTCYPLSVQKKKGRGKGKTPGEKAAWKKEEPMRNDRECEKKNDNRTPV